MQQNPWVIARRLHSQWAAALFSSRFLHYCADWIVMHEYVEDAIRACYIESQCHLTEVQFVACHGFQHPT